jgi:hypothetical protein
MAANATLNLGFPFAHPSRLIQAYALSLGIAGTVSSNDRVYEVLAVLFALGVIGSTFTFGSSAGWLLQL